MNERLYVLVDERLSIGQQAAQAAHAVAAHCLKFPDKWKNDTIVILQAPLQMVDDLAKQHEFVGFCDSYFTGKGPRTVAFTEDSIPNDFYRKSINELKLIGKKNEQVPQA